MIDDRPPWARRITREREARQWSQAKAIEAMRMHAKKDKKELPEETSLLRQWKRWEAGEVTPSDFYQTFIAAAFGTVRHAMFAVPGRGDANSDIIAVSGMNTLELVSRIQASDVDQATLDAVRVIADQFCREYPYKPGEQLLEEARSWLGRLGQLQEHRLTLKQHREVLVLAGWLTLLIGCVEYDLSKRQAAETTRQAALSLGTETENSEISGWAHEMRAWMAITSGDYHGVIAAAKAGTEVAPNQSVAVQLAAQEAKAWARIGDRRQTEVALDRGRRLLDAMPYPENLDHHFVIDPTKFDFYAMDCYRRLGEDPVAENLADEVIQAGTDFDGTERSPMRIAEARITLGVVAARQGDLEQAVHYGERALQGQRRSLPSILMASRDLTKVLKDRYQNESATKSYMNQLHELSRGKSE